MSSWNYRVVKSIYYIDEICEDEYSIHEVYYDDNGNISTWNHNIAKPFGVSEKTLKADLEAMLEAFNKPILEENIFF